MLRMMMDEIQCKQTGSIQIPLPVQQLQYFAVRVDIVSSHVPYNIEALNLMKTDKS